MSFEEFSEAAKKISEYIYNHLTDKEGWGNISTKNNVILIYHKGANWILSALLPKENIKLINDSESKEPPTDFRRGYPFEYLERPDQWRLMEQDAKSNLVLSDDQIDVVSQDHQDYPMFITGRAGSGKSTMLQYLFAEIILRYLVCKPKEGENEYLLPPVYLSYSKTLIDDAEKLAVSLLDKNDSYHKAMENCNLEYRRDIAPVKDAFFAVFRDLLIKCVREHSSEKFQKLFPNSKYISFPTFKRKWEDKFGKNTEAKKKYGPSLCWHVIRTYIKGWNAQTIMTPEMYVEECKSPSVSSATYKIIFDKVWEKWYKRLSSEEGYWDDQDIVRFCLEKEYAEEMFSAVYCDEAQDFTRIELDFILNISSFSHRTIHNVEDIKKIPFVFAGDEFQTLNPTGFSWDSLRGYFVDRLFELTGLGDKKDISKLPEPIEFHENFRSTRQIVKLANKIQLIRATRFGEYSKPQIPHFSVDGASIYCVSPTENMSFWEAVKGHQVLMIAPIAEGENVEDYINNSPLKGKIIFQNGIPQNIRIYSPAQAKGLEFANVVIYGFGLAKEGSDFRTKELLKWFDKPDSNSERDIELKYQICNAYVAVTRATSRLYILDEFTPNSFWSFAFTYIDHEKFKENRLLQEKMMLSLSSTKRNEWKEVGESDTSLIGGILDGSDKKVTFDDLTVKDSKEEIERMEQNAANQHDAFSFRQVAVMYEVKGNSKKAAECQAKALEEEGKFLDASKEFEKAEEYGEALKCYWTALYEKYSNGIIVSISKLRKYIPEDTRIKWCERIEQSYPMLAGDLRQIIVDVSQWIESHPDEQLAVWQNIIKEVANRITFTDDRHAPKDFDVIIEHLPKLQERGIALNFSEIAEAAYRSGSKKQAISLWEKLDRKLLPKEYFIAQYEMSPYPQKIIFAEGTGEQDWAKNILKEYEKNKKIELSQSEKVIICKAVRNSHSYLDFKEIVPYMFSLASSLEEVNTLLAELTLAGITGINQEAFIAVAMAKLSDLSTWERPIKHYLDPSADLLFNAIESIKQFNQTSYQVEIGRELKSGKSIKDLLQPFKIYSRSRVAPLVFINLGKLLENRGIYKDTVPYYEQVRALSDDKSFETEMDIRWIVCKERWGKETENDAHIIDALEKRKELNLSNRVFPETPALSNEEWERLYDFALSIKGEFKGNRRPRIGEKNPTSSLEDNNKPDDVSISSDKSEDRSSAKQEFHYQDYILTFLPSKSIVMLKYTTEEDEYNMKIKGGEFPDSGEFELKDGRIYISETGYVTPFFFAKTDHSVVISIKDNEKETGISITFDIR